MKKAKRKSQRKVDTITMIEIISHTMQFLRENEINWKDVDDHIKAKIMSAKHNLDLVYWLGTLTEVPRSEVA